MSNTSNTSGAYVLLVTDENTLLTTQKKRIVQRSKLVDDLWFLAAPTYNGYDMAGFTVMLEYMLPVSKKYCSEILTVASDTYNGYIKYHLPFDTSLTQEAGEVELMLTFIQVDMDEEGRTIQRVRKITGGTVTIVPVTAWSDVIPDSALSALDQRIIMADAQIKALNDMAEILMDSKADGLRYNTESNELQLVSGKVAIGNKVVLDTTCDAHSDGIPAVDLNAIVQDISETKNNVVTF